MSKPENPSRIGEYPDPDEVILDILDSFEDSSPEVAQELAIKRVTALAESMVIDLVEQYEPSVTVCILTEIDDWLNSAILFINNWYRLQKNPSKRIKKIVDNVIYVNFS